MTGPCDCSLARIQMFRQVHACFSENAAVTFVGLRVDLPEVVILRSLIVHGVRDGVVLNVLGLCKFGIQTDHLNERRG